MVEMTDEGEIFIFLFFFKKKEKKKKEVFLIEDKRIISLFKKVYIHTHMEDFFELILTIF